MSKRRVQTRGQRIAGQIVEHWSEGTPGVSAQSWAVIEVAIADAIDAAIKRAVAAERKLWRQRMREYQDDILSVGGGSQ